LGELSAAVLARSDDALAKLTDHETIQNKNQGKAKVKWQLGIGKKTSTRYKVEEQNERTRQYREKGGEGLQDNNNNPPKDDSTKWYPPTQIASNDRLKRSHLSNAQLALLFGLRCCVWQAPSRPAQPNRSLDIRMGALCLHTARRCGFSIDDL
jgi:hypothetical protein